MQVVPETLQAWLDIMATLSIDIAWMDDLPAPRRERSTASTLFVLEGLPVQFAQLWHATKQLEALPFVICWEEITMQIVSQEYCTFLVAILAVGAEAWHFLQTDTDEDDEHTNESSIGTP